MFSAYDRRDFDNPQNFVTNCVTMLSQYPEAVMAEVCDPKTGIQTRLKWPPKISELREWCERVLGEHQNRRRREDLAKHRVLVDTPQGQRSEADAERLRLGKGIEGATSQLRITGPAGEGADVVEHCLRRLYIVVSKADREAQIVRPAGTTKARVSIEAALRRHMGGSPDTVRSTCRLLVDNRRLYDEAVERERLHGDGWRTLTQRIHEHHSGLEHSPIAEPKKPTNRDHASQAVRDAQVDGWETVIRPTMKRSAYARPSEPPPGMTDEQRKEWFDKRLETLAGQPVAKLSADALAIMGRPSIDRGSARED